MSGARRWQPRSGKIIEERGSAPIAACARLYQEIHEQSDIMITWEMFEDAMMDLQDDDVIMMAGYYIVRVLH